MRVGPLRTAAVQEPQTCSASFDGQPSFSQRTTLVLIGPKCSPVA